jgi:hypothetical protein
MAWAWRNPGDDAHSGDDTAAGRVREIAQILFKCASNSSRLIAKIKQRQKLAF